MLMELIYKFHLRFIIVIMNFVSILISMIASAASITYKFKIPGRIHEGAIISTYNASNDKQWHYIIKSKLLTKTILCLLCVKFLKKILLLYITVKLNFDIGRKSANFDFKNSQNISVDQIITELSTFLFHYELVKKNFMESKRFSYQI